MKPLIIVKSNKKEYNYMVLNRNLQSLELFSEVLVGTVNFNMKFSYSFRVPSDLHWSKLKPIPICI
jgi:hypothetical protein